MNINLQPILENQTIQLCPLNEKDFDLLYAVAADPEIWKQHPNKDRWKKEVFETFFEGAIQSGGAFRVVDKSTNATIGSTRFYDYNPEDKSIFIGYTFYATAYWGKGVNPAVKALMLNYIFQFADKVYFHIGSENIRSQIAISRLGAVKAGEQEVTYFGELPKLNFVYEIVKRNWQQNKNFHYAKGSFGYDLHFLKQHHKDLIVLGDDSSGAAVIILPAYQGRVMTSTTEGMNGISFGWVNHELIASDKPAEHMNAFGGEERIWPGPEGGQFSVYFKKGTEFTYDNWFVPKEFDTEPFDVVNVSPSQAGFKKAMRLKNYSGSVFDLEIERNIRLMDKKRIEDLLELVIPEGIKMVGFESENRLINTGNNAWDKKTGMLSVWILCMMNASDKTTVAIPYKQSEASALGNIVTDDYFGKVPADRLKVENGLILFKADAKHRAKIGISPLRAMPVTAGYDAVNQVLTINRFSLPEGVNEYVNSLWQMQDEPFMGDAVNAYNDGPINGTQMGRFYEVESSSPAAALKPNEAIVHHNALIHFTGDKESLDKISMKLLGVPVDGISLH
jgi:RimJ/RimL family protein N-acetyltransferase